MPTCPTCKGETKLLAFFPVYAPHVPQEERKPVIAMECHTCAGDGWITDGQASLIALGEELRRKRKLKLFGLRECATQLGILPSALSNAEQGRVPAMEIMQIMRLVDAMPNRPAATD